jgi:hypothetical protein
MQKQTIECAFPLYCLRSARYFATQQFVIAPGPEDGPGWENPTCCEATMVTREAVLVGITRMSEWTS